MSLTKLNCAFLYNNLPNAVKFSKSMDTNMYFLLVSQINIGKISDSILPESALHVLVYEDKIADIALNFVGKIQSKINSMQPIMWIKSI